MKKLFIVIILLGILVFLNQGNCQVKPILIDSAQNIIMQNSWIKVEITKQTGEISALVYMHSNSAKNLLTGPAGIFIRDKRDNSQYQQSDGAVNNFYTESYSDSVKVIFVINFNFKTPKPRYTLQSTFTLDSQGLRWDAKLQINQLRDWEANIDFSFPVIANMEYAFWTNPNAPFKLPITRTVIYRKWWDVWTVIPALILYNTASNMGLSVVSPFEIKKPGLEYQLDSAQFVISNYHLHLSKKQPARAAIYIVPHEGCWRPGFAWLYYKYPEYFNPISNNLLKGEGWYMMVDERTDPLTIANFAKRGVKWVEFFHFPFFGLYAPPDKNPWNVLIDTFGISYNEWMRTLNPLIRITSYEKNRKQIDSLLHHGIQPYMYFESFESWKQYAKKYYPKDITMGANNDTLPAWQSCYLMNPDPKHPWGKHIISQLNKLLDKYPKADGIFYDRDDYCDYDYAHDDNVTMIDSIPVYMLGFAQEKINDSIVNKVHERGKGVWTNGPTSVEVCKGMDGIMSENLQQAPYLQYLGIARPLILLPYDTTPQQTEEKLKTALYTGHFPNIAWYRANPQCVDIDTRYQPLFSLYKGKKWVLYPRALQLSDGIKGNIFQTPDSGYLVALVDPEKFSIKSDPFRYDLWAKVRVPNDKEIEYCYLLSGDYKGVDQDSIYRNNGIEIKIPANRAATLIRLSKEPRYEITRTSSPVLTRGESEKLEIRIQNIEYNEKKKYDVKLITPFGTKAVNFSLEPKQSRKVELDFKVPKDFALGETTMKVIVQSAKKDTVVFTSWVVDVIQFQLPENIFIHFVEGEDIPFSLVNNTERTLKVRLTGNFKEGRGKIKLSTQSIVLIPLEAKELVLNILADSEVGKFQLIAKVENRTVEVFCPVERAMKLEPSDYFQDDFSSDNMDKWNTTFGTWKTENGIAQGSGHMHLAVKNGNWKDFKFQVNTRLEGSTNSLVDWIKSYIFFRIQDDNNFYRFGIARDINLFKRKNGIGERLGKYDFDAKKNVWYNLRVEVVGDSINGFLDGNQVISVQDTTFKSGGIGIGVLEDDMINYYDDVIVRPIGQ